MIKFGYKVNEWLAVYVDECGNRQVMPFDTIEQAYEYLKRCSCRIGVMTTAFYNRFVEEVGTEIW